MVFAAFEALLSDLDELGADEYGEQWESRVEDRLAALEAYYGNQNLLNQDRPLIDYGNLDTQMAYMFMYAPGRAEFAYQLLKRFRQRIGQPLFSEGTLRVTSLGGGPGSELVGLMKYLNDKSFGESINSVVFRILDKHDNWNHVFELLSSKLDSQISVDIEFDQIDICDEEACDSISLAGTDLLILSFFISEICRIPKSADAATNINKMLRSLPVGARVLYNDSDAYSFYMFMNGRARAVKGLKEQHEVQDTISISGPDLSGVFEEMMDRYGRTPHLNSRAVAKIYLRDNA